MTEQKWEELLERAADRTAVGPAPLPAIRAGAARRRRRSVFAATASVAAAVVVVIGGAVLLTTPGVGPQTTQPPAASDGPASDGPAPVPAGTRLVGLGNVAIAVPQEWGTNQTRCGTPQKDTVVINVGAVELCAIGRPEGIESVEVVQGDPRFDFQADSTVRIDGEEALRRHTTCTRDTLGGVRTCSGTVYFPAHHTWFHAESSTSPEDVDRVLDRIHVDPQRVGVPAYQPLADNAQGRSGDTYAARLSELGFDVEVLTRKVSAGKPGYVLDASPAPGTMLPRGSSVTVTVVAAPEGPADEVSVEVATDDDAQVTTDPQLRAGDTTLRLDVGERIWAYAQGRHADSLTGELQGDALAVDDWEDGPNHPHAWVATAPGRTTIVLSIEADGERVELGRVLVLVR